MLTCQHNLHTWLIRRPSLRPSHSKSSTQDWSHKAKKTAKHYHPAELDILIFSHRLQLQAIDALLLLQTPSSPLPNRPLFSLPNASFSTLTACLKLKYEMPRPVGTLSIYTIAPPDTTTTPRSRRRLQRALLRRLWMRSHASARTSSRRRKAPTPTRIQISVQS
jgi:hypothetical protein